MTTLPGTSEHIPGLICVDPLEAWDDATVEELNHKLRAEFKTTAYGHLYRGVQHHMTMERIFFNENALKKALGPFVGGPSPAPPPHFIRVAVAAVTLHDMEHS